MYTKSSTSEILKIAATWLLYKKRNPYTKKFTKKRRGNAHFVILRLGTEQKVTVIRIKILEDKKAFFRPNIISS